MMKLKTLAGAALCVAALALFTTANASENILYFNDFEDYQGGAFAQTVSDGQGWTGITNTDKLEAVNVNESTWLDPQGSSTWTFDMGNPRMESGKLHISYNVISDGEDENGASNIRFHYKNNEGKTIQKYLLFTRTKGSQDFAYKVGLNSTGTTTPIMNYTPGQDYKVDIIWDIDNKLVSIAIDGGTVTEVKSSTSCPVEQIVFANQPGLMFDNLKIQYYDTTAFSIKEAWIEDSAVMLKFFETVRANSVLEGIELKNLYDGTSVSVEAAELVSGDTLKLTIAGEVSYFDEYSLKLPEGFCDFFGTELSAAQSVSFADPNGGFAVERIVFEDYDGNKYSLADSLPPEIKNISIEFSKEVEEDSIASGISLTSKSNQAALETPVSFETNGKTVKLSLGGCLYAKEDYELLLNGLESIYADILAKTYQIPFSVGDGGLKITEYNFYKNGAAVSAQELNAGDEITLTFRAIKPVREAMELYLSYGIYEDSLMTGFNIAKVAFEENKTAAEGTLSLTVPDSADFILKGFLWQKAGGFPVAEQIELTKN